jgi:O-antigen/teichoic acid export membrane protein
LGVLLAHLHGPLGRGGLFLTLNQAIVSGLGFLFWVVAARSYPPEAVGHATSVIAAGSFMAIVATLGLPYALVRGLSRSREPKRLALAVLRSAALFGLVAGVAGGVAMGALSKDLAFLLDDPISLGLLVLLVVSFALEAVLEQAFVAARRVELSTVMLAAFGAMRLAGPLLAPAAGSRELLAAWAISMLVAVGMALLALLPRTLAAVEANPQGEPARVRPLLAYAGKNHAATLLSLAGPSLLPATLLVAVGGSAGAHASAVFYLTFQVASLIFVIPIALALVQFAEGARPGADRRLNERRALTLAFLTAGPGAVALALLAGPVLSFFGPAYAAEGAPLLRVLALATFVVVPSTILATRFRLEGRLQAPILAAGLASGAAIAGAIVSVPAWGVVGAGVAFMAGQALSAGVLAFFPRKPEGGEPHG